MSIVIGLIGAGNISQAHLPAYRNYQDDIQLNAVCDAREGRAEEVANEFDVDYWMDFEPFVEEADIDAVDITSIIRLPVLHLKPISTCTWRSHSLSQWKNAKS
jgi:predicted dehydrogenase